MKDLITMSWGEFMLKEANPSEKYLNYGLINYG